MNFNKIRGTFGKPLQVLDNNLDRHSINDRDMLELRRELNVWLNSGNDESIVFKKHKDRLNGPALWISDAFNADRTLILSIVFRIYTNQSDRYVVVSETHEEESNFTLKMLIKPSEGIRVDDIFYVMDKTNMLIAVCYT